MVDVESRMSTGFRSDSLEALRVDRLVRRYGDHTAVADVTFEVGVGEVLGLLGANGAGKTTTVRTVVGLDEPDGGFVRVNGGAPRDAVRSGAVAYCSQDLAVYPSLTTRKNLEFFAEAAGGRRSSVGSLVASTAQSLGLSSLLDRRLTELSGGEQRRVHFAAAIVNSARVLVLDEPTAGVDVESRRLVLDGVRAAADQGRGVLYTSHNLVEVEQLCDRVVILDRGTVACTAPVAELVADKGQVIRLEFDRRQDVDPAAAAFGDHFLPRRRGMLGLDLIPIDTDSGEGSAARSASALAEVCDARGWLIRRVEVVAGGLEAAYLRVSSAETARADDRMEVI